MLNPELYGSSMISPRQMFNYDRGLNKSWNMSEYRTPRIYQDPALQIQKRKWAVQEKGKKTDKYLTKRGFYMDYELKVAKSIPGSSIFYLIQIHINLRNLGPLKNNYKCQKVEKLIRNSLKIPFYNKLKTSKVKEKNLELELIAFKNH